MLWCVSTTRKWVILGINVTNYTGTHRTTIIKITSQILSTMDKAIGKMGNTLKEKRQWLIYVVLEVTWYLLIEDSHKTSCRTLVSQGIIQTYYEPSSENSNGTNKGQSNSNSNADPMNFVGTLICTSSIDFGNFSCKCFELDADLWILYLTNITLLPYPILVSLLNGYKVKVTEFDNVPISSQIILHNVLYVPSLKYNFISVHSLALSLKCMVLFTGAFCLLQALQ